MKTDLLIHIGLNLLRDLPEFVILGIIVWCVYNNTYDQAHLAALLLIYYRIAQNGKKP